MVMFHSYVRLPEGMIGSCTTKVAVNYDKSIVGKPIECAVFFLKLDFFMITLKDVLELS